MAESLLISGLNIYSKPEEVTQYPLAQLTAIIGPNGAGKTRLLHAIKGAAERLNKNVVEGFSTMVEVVPASPAESRIERLATQVNFDPNSKHYYWRGQWITRGTPPTQTKEEIVRAFASDAIHWVAGQLHLSGHYDRVRHLQHQNANTRDIQQGKLPTLVHKLFASPEWFSSINNSINEAFDLFVYADSGDYPSLSLRIGTPNHPPNIVRKNAFDLNPEHQAFIDSLWKVSETSAGTQAYIALVADIIGRSDQIVLLDEPEIALSPSLQRLAGKLIAGLAAKGNAQIIFATHSPELLSGAIQLGATLQVLRVTNRGAQQSITSLPAKDLSALARDPLLRNTPVLEALFHRNALLVENPADGVLYSEIDHRLKESAEEGLFDTCLIPTYGTGKIPHLLQKLNSLGVRTGAIVDLDVLETGGAFWSDLLTAAGITGTLLANLQSGRANCWKAIETARPAKGVEGHSAPATKWGKVPASGISALSGGDQAALRSLLDDLAKFGLFVVPVGELEQWFGTVELDRTKSDFLGAVLNWIGETSPTPSSDSDPIWDFLRRISTWTKAALQ